MSKHALIPSRRLFALCTAAAEARVSETYGKVPLHFEANRGQAHEEVRFLARGPGYGLYLTAGEAVLVLRRKNEEEIAPAAAWGIAVDGAGNAYVAGGTSSTNFPTVDPIQATFAGYPSDAFVAKLKADGSAPVYSTYLGGSGSDNARGVAVDIAGSAYVLGETNSTDFPTVNPIQATRAGGLQNDGVSQDVDTFVAKIVEVALPPGSTAAPSDPSATRSEESAATYTGRWTSYGAETGTFSGGSVLASNEIGASATFSFTGTAVTWMGVKCSLCGIASVSIDGGAPMIVNTAGPASSNFTSEPVFSASGLDPAVTHTMVIRVTGTSTSGDAHIAVDAFDVMASPSDP